MPTFAVEHLTHFTDMLGASHSPQYTMWKMGNISTDGMKEIAEWGNTYKGEQEMKENVRRRSKTRHEPDSGKGNQDRDEGEGIVVS